MLFVPNIIWARNRPEGYDAFAPRENRILLALERAGEALTCVCALIFSDLNIRAPGPDIVVLLLSFAFMLLYECFWIRYFRGGRTMQDFYSSMLGIPVAGATLPVIAFFLLGVYGANGPLLISVMILGIGHIGIHLGHRKELKEPQVRAGRAGAAQAVTERNVAGWLGQGGSRTAGSGAGQRRLTGGRAVLRTVCTVLKAVGLLVLVLLALALTVWFSVRNVIFIRGTVNPTTGIYEEGYVSLCGQELFVRIRGRKRSNPVVVHLHGGPGSPDACIGYTFMDPLLDKATFVTWDQRGCGRTYFRNRKADPDNATADFKQAQADLDALVDYVREKFSTEKVIIEGHSYGTFLGTAYVMAHPDKVAAYISIGQCTELHYGDILSCEDAVYRAEMKGDDTAEMRRAGETFAADGSFFNLMKLREFTEKYHKAPVGDKTMLRGALSPYFNLVDARWIFGVLSRPEKMYAVNHKLLDHLLASRIYDFGVDYRVPVLFISGEYDWVTPRGLVEEYCAAVSAPYKKMISIEGCGHTPQADRPGTVMRTINEFLNQLRQE